MTTIDKFWAWLVKSSSDTEQVALTAKGLITSLVPILLYFCHNPNVNTLPDVAYTPVIAFFTIISGLQIIFGMVRKVILTFTS